MAINLRGSWRTELTIEVTSLITSCADSLLASVRDTAIRELGVSSTALDQGVGAATSPATARGGTGRLASL